MNCHIIKRRIRAGLSGLVLCLFSFTSYALCEREVANVLKSLNKGDDRTKAEALFNWITSNISYDVKFYLSDYATEQFKEKQSVCEVLRTKKAVCEGYSQLFMRLGQEMGLEVEVIKGYSKQYGDGYLDWERSMHSWNAMAIDGTWYLVDPTWGSGHLEGDRFVAERNDRYLFIPPEELVKTHIPFDPMWQLTKRVITFDSYTSRSESPVYLQDFNCLDTLAAYYALDSVERKRTSLRRQIAYNPRNGYAFFNLGVVEYDRGKTLLTEYEATLEETFESGELYERYDDFRLELEDILNSFRHSKQYMDATIALKKYTHFGNSELNIREISAFQEVLIGFHQANLKFKVGYDALKRFDDIFNEAETVDELKQEKANMVGWLDEATRFFSETASDAQKLNASELKPEVQNAVQQLEQAATGNLGLIDDRRQSLLKYTG